MRTIYSMPFRLLLLSICILFSTFRNDAYADETNVADMAYKGACGPFSCLVALKLLGISSSIQKVGEACAWRENQPVSLSTMREALNSYVGIECQAVRLSPDELCDLLGDSQSVAILAIRKNSDQIDHAVCAASIDASKTLIQWYDYPELKQAKEIAGIVEVWDGEALIVRASMLSRVADNVVLFFLPTLVIIYALNLARRRFLV